MGVSLYASAGIGVPGPAGRGHAHTVEVFTGIKQDCAQVREAFANLITSLVGGPTPHPARHGVFVAGDWEIIDGRNFTGWILTERPDELIPDLQLKDGRHITFPDALPVFPEEADLRHGNRAEELLGMWEEWEVESADLDRGMHPRPAPLQLPTALASSPSQNAKRTLKGDHGLPIDDTLQNSGCCAHLLNYACPETLGFRDNF